MKTGVTDFEIGNYPFERICCMLDMRRACIIFCNLK